MTVTVASPTYRTAVGPQGTHMLRAAVDEYEPFFRWKWNLDNAADIPPAIRSAVIM